jgi:hypothetical protein
MAEQAEAGGRRRRCGISDIQAAWRTFIATGGQQQLNPGRCQSNDRSAGCWGPLRLCLCICCWPLPGSRRRLTSYSVLAGNYWILFCVHLDKLDLVPHARRHLVQDARHHLAGPAGHISQA